MTESRTPPSPSLAGEVLGKYKVLGHLGRGGMADVFVAVDRTSRTGELLALKVLRDFLADDPEWAASFLEEANVSQQLEHPNIVRTVDVGDLGGSHALVLEYLEGGSLAELRRQHQHAGTTMPLDVGLFALTEALAGLHHAHEKTASDGRPIHLVHRDFTPNNIFATLDGAVKVLDFGLAKSTETSAKTSTGVVKGTIRYVAPEAILGLFVDRRVDIYAAGVSLWEMASGQRAWNGLADVTILNSVSTGATLSLRAARPDADDELVTICDRALANGRKDRFATAAEMRDALVAYVAKNGLFVERAAFAAYVEETLGPSCRARRAQFEEARRASVRPPSNPRIADSLTETRRFGMEETRTAHFTTSVSTKVERASRGPAPRRRGRIGPWLAGGASLLAVAGVALALHRSPSPAAAPGSPPAAQPIPPPRESPPAPPAPPAEPSPSTPAPQSTLEAWAPTARSTPTTTAPRNAETAKMATLPRPARSVDGPPQATGAPTTAAPEAPRRIDEKNPFE